MIKTGKKEDELLEEWLKQLQNDNPPTIINVKLF